VSEIERCPGCEANLRLGRPKLFRQATRTLAVYVPHIHECALFWGCPDCGHRWHRWPPGDRLRIAAAPYVGAD
jgi:hypothetical protein